MKKNCLECFKEFEAQEKEVKRGNAKFCSLQCSSKFNRKLFRERANQRKIPNATCANCGILFYRKKNLSKSGLHFCCRKHKDESQRIGGIEAIMPDHYGTGQRSYRDLALLNKPAICERCGWNKNIAGIVIHHKDRDRTNNKIENLEVLCACCHAIEHLGKCN
jgi:hypothetical protein